MSEARGRLAGKVAVITGAASGIGEGTARLFVAEGAQVIVADMQDEAGEALVTELGNAARFARCNVTVEADVAANWSAEVDADCRKLGIEPRVPKPPVKKDRKRPR